MVIDIKSDFFLFIMQVSPFNGGLPYPYGGASAPPVSGIFDLGDYYAGQRWGVPAGTSRAIWDAGKSAYRYARNAFRGGAPGPPPPPSVVLQNIAAARVLRRLAGMRRYRRKWYRRRKWYHRY